MARPVIDTLVQLVKDLPELGLASGQIGAVKSVWCEPRGTCEVEFCFGEKSSVRALLFEDAIHLVCVPLRANC